MKIVVMCAILFRDVSGTRVMSFSSLTYSKTDVLSHEMYWRRCTFITSPRFIEPDKMTCNSSSSLAQSFVLIFAFPCICEGNRELFDIHHTKINLPILQYVKKHLRVSTALGERSKEGRVTRHAVL